MGQPWIILKTRYGGDLRDPTAAHLAQAVRELFEEDSPGMTGGDDDEHGAAHLRYGTDDGPEYFLAVTRGGLATFEAYADPDDDDPIEPPAVLVAVTPGLALELWGHLARGDVDAVRRHPWHRTP